MWALSYDAFHRDAKGNAVQKSRNHLVVIATAPAAPTNANVPATPAASALPATAEAAANPAEPHPQIREALGALRRAKEHLQHAAHDFGGHRDEALEATDKEIAQLEIGLKFDKN